MLPEPEKTIAKDHLASTFNWYALPFECRKHHRRPWHSQAEGALQQALLREDPCGFAMEDIVQEAGIAPLDQPAAAKYLQILLSEQVH
jgi:hypothetical protein